jgi:hypothetical protein
MNYAEYIVEKMLDDEELKGTGVFMKQLDSGRKVYSCKCPTCGTIHGGYRSYQQAMQNLKCREHHRKEIEKSKKEIEKVDEPKKEKDLFKNPNKEMSFAEAEEDFEADETGDWKDVTDLGPDRVMYTIYDGTEFYPVTRDGLITRQGSRNFSGQWKVQGMTFHILSTTPVPWEELRMRMSRGGKLKGYIWDLDHGTTRKWSRLATIDQNSSVSEKFQDELALLAGVSNL